MPESCPARRLPGRSRGHERPVDLPRRGLRAVPWHPSGLTSRAATHYARQVIAHRLRLISLLALALLGTPMADGAVAGTKPARTILVLHSFDQGPGWVESVTAGIESTFARDRTYSWIIRHEYLNVLETDPRDYPALFRLRFPRTRFHAVICVDNQALEFAVQNRAEFFPGVPIVFCGVDQFEPAMLRGERGVTGLIDELDFTGTFALMRLLHPEATSLIIFANSSIRAERAAYERLVAAARREFRQEMTLEFWEDPELPDIRARASSIPAGTIAFTLAFFSDEEGRPLPLAEGTRAVADAIGIPIYSCWESVLGSGIVGGSITRGSLVGSAAADLALRTLRGGDADAMPVEHPATTALLLDWNELRRAGVPLHLVPRGAEIVNSPFTFYQRYRTWVWAGAALVAVLVALLVVSLAYGESQRRLKRQVGHSEQRLAAALEATGSGVWEYDPAHGETYYDTRWFTMLGYAPDTLRQEFNTWISLLHPDDRDRARDEVTRHMREGTDFQTEFRMRAADGSWRWIVSRGAVAERDASGRVRRMVGTHLDVTDWRAAEERERAQARQLIQQDKLASLGVLVSGVAHEINNPNNFILLNGRLCARVWKDLEPVLEDYRSAHGEFLLAGMPSDEAQPRIAQMMDGIAEGAQRIKKIVQSLRDFARRDADDLTREVDPNAVVDSAVTLVRHLLDKCTGAFVVSCDPGLPRVRASFQQLEQVVVNLLTNACDALPSRDRSIRVATRRDADADRVLIEVADEGTGIAEEHRARIFDPFFTTKQDRGGTGLGLSISYSIVRDHGGELTLEPGLHGGTVATIRLPAACCSADAPAPPAEAPR
jgi:PAS domain S-box-containing protein